MYGAGMYLARIKDWTPGTIALCYSTFRSRSARIGAFRSQHILESDSEESREIRIVIRRSRYFAPLFTSRLPKAENNNCLWSHQFPRITSVAKFFFYQEGSLRSFFLSRWAAAKVFLATVYQKHSSLRTRKWMYRG